MLVLEVRCHDAFLRAEEVRVLGERGREVMSGGARSSSCATRIYRLASLATS